MVPFISTQFKKPINSQREISQFKEEFQKGNTTKEKKQYLDHLYISGLLKQARKAGAVDAEGEVTHKEFEVLGETGLILITQNLIFLVVGGNGNVTDEPGRQGQKPSRRRRKRNGIGVKLEREARKGDGKEGERSRVGEGQGFREGKRRKNQGRGRSHGSEVQSRRKDKDKGFFHKRRLRRASMRYL